MAELHELGLVDLREVVRDGRASRAEIARAFLERASTHDEKTHAWLHLHEGVVDEAEALDAAAGDGVRLSLEGLPLAVKDNICTEDVPTTCASRILEGWKPPYDSTAWSRLKDAGALLLGKTNLDEFAMGSSNEHSAFGPTSNPWNPERVPGGSSGGSAAAVAAGMAPAALGSDTGGSIRQPAALCGVVGLKPTYGRVSRYGLVAFASSLEQIGPLARSPLDCALLLDAMAGPDPRDSTSAASPEEPRCLETARREQGPFRFGLPPEAEAEGLEPDVRDAVEESCAVLEEIGGERVDVSLPHTPYGIAVYYIIAPAEASSNLARYDGVRHGLRRQGDGLLDTYRKTRSAGFGPETKRRIMLGTYVLSAGYYDQYYLRASRLRTLLQRDFDAAFEEVDVIVTPTTPGTAFRIGERTDDPLSMYLSDAFTVPASLTGLPALSLPCGLDADGLPIGLQLVGPAFSEADLLRLGHHFLLARPFDRRPPA